MLYFVYLNKIRTILQDLVAIFFPRCCRVCSRKAEGELFCPECRRALQKPLWLRGQEYLDGVIILFKYDGLVKELLQAAKFKNKRGVIYVLAEEVKYAVDSLDLKNSTLLINESSNFIFVPTSEDRFLARGFDIPQILFKNFKKDSGITLKRVRSTESLYGLNPYERRLAVENCFEVDGVVASKDIVLLDDIFTTGATMNEAAHTLKLAGAKNVYGLAFCGSKENYSEK